MLTATVTIAPIAQTPAYAAPVCTNPIAPGRRVADAPWAQQRLAPDRLAPFATGAGITVAVIDSGVDPRHPQLKGRVRSGADFLDPTGQGLQDCVGHGTAVASIIAGRPLPEGAPFRGLAPDARILPVRVSEQRVIDGKENGRTVTAAQFGEAIRWAVQHGARVLNLSVVLYEDSPAVRTAIEYAQANDVVVVAAVGNSQERGNPYPAAYDGVLGVGAIGPDGTRETYSQIGSYVDVMAPGGQVVVAVPRGGYGVESGTSYATPYVAATAALVRDYWDIPAKEVVRRIIATADPAAGGRHSDAYGAGIVNPYRAVTEAVAQGRPVHAAPLPRDRADPAQVVTRERLAGTRDRALMFAGVGGALAAVALVIALVLPRGVRRRWRPAEPA
ncbi:MAG TPA: type VII secretion-associated serine protease mycosin [Pilimelia sp.]|nr:type VII secretion-associated serine protease mycosin [Pilimelia sp.]